MHIAHTCFENISPPDFWSLADEYPDLVTRLHTQGRLIGSFGVNGSVIGSFGVNGSVIGSFGVNGSVIGSFGVNGSVPWVKDTEGALCFICEEDIENTCHFFLDCP